MNQENTGKTPFLRQVAMSVPLEDRCFIFPNRRSMVFFRKYLSEEARKSGRPLVMPGMMTENDFFLTLGQKNIADRIALLVHLYDCYKVLNDKAEPLDDFVFWGDVLLGDFDDVDKYLVDPHRIFANITDLKSLQDDWSFLTEAQRAAIEQFVRHFDTGLMAGNVYKGAVRKDAGQKGSEENGSAGKGTDVKEGFLRIWNILEPLYLSFREKLSGLGLAYEGMVYRDVAESLKTRPVADLLKETFPESGTFVFVGLNALNECERTVLKGMQKAGIAEFCWDWSGKLIRDSRNKASFFMVRNLADFPQTYRLEDVGESVPQIEVISVPSNTGQVKVVPDIVRNAPDSAIVLPDSSLLDVLLNSLPPEIEDINVTMGCSLPSSAVYALMAQVMQMQLNAVNRGGAWCFYHKYVHEIFASGLFRRVADEETTAIMARIRSEAKVFIPEKDFGGSEILQTIFRAAVKDRQTTDIQDIHDFSDYLKEALTVMASRFVQTNVSQIEMEFAKEWYCCLNRLDDMSLSLMPKTFVSLLDRLLCAVSVPFRGEPLKGLQIMGPLETRALDFRNIVILSANEGTFPARGVSTSFIPAELRKSFGLPTYEYRDAMHAYYFYRMISRADKVWMVYDSRTEGMHTGEESRFIRQLDYHYRLPLQRKVAWASPGEGRVEGDIPKTEEHVRRIREKWLSASSLRNYLICPAMFYYSQVEGLKVADEVAEVLDGGMFGNVFHEVMFSVFSGEQAMKPDFVPDKNLPGSGVANPLKRVDAAYLKSWLKRRDEIHAKVGSVICRTLKSPELYGRNIVVADVITRYVLKTLERDLELLAGSGSDGFEILGLEKCLTGEYGGFRFVGFVDRLDSLRPGTVRVNDYKTGRVEEMDENITDGNAAEVAAAVFGKEVARRPKIAFQVFIYDLLVGMNGCRDEIYNTIYKTTTLYTDPIVPEKMSPVFMQEMEKGLKGLLEEIADLSIPFSRTTDTGHCTYCDFRIICGR